MGDKMDATPLSIINNIRKIFIPTSYSQKKRNEINFYQNVFKDSFFQKSNPAWDETEAHCTKLIQKTTGDSGLCEYVSSHTKNKKKVKILGLGSGACGVEIEGIYPLLHKNGTLLDLTCVDINKTILNKAKLESAKKQIKFHALIRDINKIHLPANTYDVVIAHASLHHFLNLDHICQQINKTLKPEGFFITVDIPTRKGYLMWPETYQVVQNLWKILPNKFKVDHTKHALPCFAKNYENVDYSTNSFECINSDNIIPSLRKHLKEKYYIPELSIARRFFDSKFGPNYDLNKPLDRSIFDFIISLDQYYLQSGILKPETFFGVYLKKIQ